jgi:hypothetical protein
MGCKIYESDKYERIMIYPFLKSPTRIKPYILTVIIKKLINVVCGKREEGLKEE